VQFYTKCAVLNSTLCSSNFTFVWGANSAPPGLLVGFGEGRRGKGRGKGKAGRKVGKEKRRKGKGTMGRRERKWREAEENNFVQL